MFAYTLIMMLFNTAKKTWHPIFYYESPLPGPIDEQAVARYKSKGHHTEGFETRDLALKSCDELKTKLITEYGSNVVMELGDDQILEWNGEGIPADTQIRPIEYLTKVA